MTPRPSSAPGTVIARALGPITVAACWLHARRKFIVLADIATKARVKKPVIVLPIALEAIRRFDVIFEWERSINGLPPTQRLAMREKEIAPLVEDFGVWIRDERAKLSRNAEVAKTMDYTLKRLTALALSNFSKEAFNSNRRTIYTALMRAIGGTHQHVNSPFGAPNIGVH